VDLRIVHTFGWCFLNLSRIPKRPLPTSRRLDGSGTPVVAVNVEFALDVKLKPPRVVEKVTSGLMNGVFVTGPMEVVRS
jgi:hypothetical protein